MSDALGGPHEQDPALPPQRPACRIGHRRRELPALGPAHPAGTDRHQVRLRRGPVRRLHRTCRRQGRASCITPVKAVSGKEVAHRGGPGPGRVPCIPCSRRSSITARCNAAIARPACCSSAHALLRRNPQAFARGDRGPPGAQPVPLRSPSADRRCDRSRRTADRRRGMSAVRGSEPARIPQPGRAAASWCWWGSARARCWRRTRGACIRRTSTPTWRSAGNGRVTVFSGKIEMGQGVLTSQAQMLAEELGVELAAIDMVLGDTDRCPWDMGTFGSLTTRMFGPALRAAGAQARLTLMALAAERLGVAQEHLVARDGIVSVVADARRKVSYGELARGAQITKVVDSKAVLRAASRIRRDGPLAAAPRRRREGDGLGPVRRRHPAARHALCPDPASAGARRARCCRRTPARPPKPTRARAWSRTGSCWRYCTPIRKPRRLAFERVKAQWQSPEARLDPENIFEHLVEAQPTRNHGRPRRPPCGTRGRGPSVRDHLSQGLCGACADRDAHGAGRREGRQGDGVGIDADALPHARPDRASPETAAAGRAGDHALRRRRLRRQERQHAGRGGGTAVAGDRPAGAGGADARRRNSSTTPSIPPPW